METGGLLLMAVVAIRTEKVPGVAVLVAVSRTVHASKQSVSLATWHPASASENVATDQDPEALRETRSVTQWTDDFQHADG